MKQIRAKLNLPLLLVFLEICCFISVQGFRVKRIITKTLTRHSDLNLPCDSAMDCRPIAYVCSPSNSTCQCADRYRANFELMTCLAEIDQRCEQDSHCIAGAFCNALKLCECELDNLTTTSQFQCNSADNLLASFYFTLFVISIQKFM